MTGDITDLWREGTRSPVLEFRIVCNRNPAYKDLSFRPAIVPSVEEGVGSMIKKQDNPYDDIFPALTEILAEIIRNLPDNQRVRVTGFSLISPGPSMPPIVFRLIGDTNNPRLPYETIESEDFIFITAQMPPDLKSSPYVEIMQDALHVFVDERAAVISTQTPVDVIHSHFTVHNRLLDITLKKLKKT